MRGEAKLFDDLDAVARDAAGALDRDARLSMFERLEWFRLVAAHRTQGGALCVARAAMGGRRGWLFLCREGSNAEALANWYSLRVGVIGDVGVMTSALAALRADGLARITLAPLADPAPLAAAFRAAGWWTDIRPQTANWQVRIGEGGFDAYWAARPGRLRAIVKRKTRTAGLNIRIHRAFDEAAWAEYEAVYAASWKGLEGAPAFLRALAEREGTAGTLRLGLAYKGEVAVAAQLWFVENGVATIHKLAYRDDSASLSPGTLLGAAMFRAVINDDRVRQVDYGAGDEAYKRDWMDERHLLWRLTAFDPRTVRGFAGAARARLSWLAGRLRSR